MKKIIVALVLSSVAALAESWTGTVVDVNCKNNDLASHTRECAVRCAKSGFGIVLADGKFIKFDERGNVKALAALKASTREQNLKSTVTGVLKEDVIQVESIQVE